MIITKDKELERKYLMQEVIDRILLYGDSYINELQKVNNQFPIKKIESPTAYCFRYQKTEKVG